MFLIIANQLVSQGRSTPWFWQNKSYFTHELFVFYGVRDSLRLIRHVFDGFARAQLPYTHHTPNRRTNDFRCLDLNAQYLCSLQKHLKAVYGWFFICFMVSVHPLRSSEKVDYTTYPIVQFSAFTPSVRPPSLPFHWAWLVAVSP